MASTCRSRPVHAIIERCDGPLVPPQRMIIWDLDQDNSQPIRIRDPHLHQPPRLLPRLAEYWHPGLKQPAMLGLHITDLDPDRHRISGRIGRASADLKKAVTQKEHEARCIPAAELPIDRQTQRVPIEPLTPVKIGGMQENSAAQNLHAAHPAACAEVSADDYSLLS
jgi:hypothetical protein